MQQSEVKPIDQALYNEPESVSICPAGDAYPLPTKKDFQTEYDRLKRIIAEQRLLGREIVVVMGVGFVGSVMAGVVADAVDKETDDPKYLKVTGQWKYGHFPTP